MSTGQKSDPTFEAIKKGLLELAILQVISKHRVYAADILRALANSPFSTQEGTLYPLLSRLYKSGYLEHEWVETEGAPPRKYYRLSTTGSQHLQSLHTYLNGLQDSLKHVGDQH